MSPAVVCPPTLVVVRGVYSITEGTRAAAVGPHPAPPALPLARAGAVGDEGGVCRHMRHKLPSRPLTSANAPRRPTSVGFDGICPTNPTSVPATTGDAAGTSGRRP